MTTIETAASTLRTANVRADTVEVKTKSHGEGMIQALRQKITGRSGRGMIRMMIELPIGQQQCELMLKLRFVFCFY